MRGRGRGRVGLAARADEGEREGVLRGEVGELLARGAVACLGVGVGVGVG